MCRYAEDALSEMPFEEMLLYHIPPPTQCDAIVLTGFSRQKGEALTCIVLVPYTSVSVHG
jgi:hypothetical protein